MKRFVLPVLAITFATACGRSMHTGGAAPVMAGATGDPRVADGLRQFRAATDAFHSIEAAVAVGYPRTVADCIIDEHHGAMGYHHLNRAYVDKTLDPTKPEMLLYQRMTDGSYKLNGAEFIVRYTDWPRDSTPPVLMGQTLHHEDSFKYWYLHVWGWSDNPDGMFANMNPNVTCPDGGKIYRANPDPPTP